MRIFYAITFNNDDKNKIKQYREIVEGHCDKGRFSRPNNYHITLQYIGEINQSELDNYKQVLKNLSTFPQKFRTNRMGTFGNKTKKIVWLGIEKNEKLEKLRQEVVANTKKLGIQLKSDQYVPHITMARQVVGLENIEPSVIQSLELKVKSVALMESTRIDNVLTYIPLEEIILS